MPIPQAYANWNPADPDVSRFVDEHAHNRVWSDEVLSGPRDSVELRRARELGGFVAGADYLLDIHSMREPCPPLMVCGVAGRGGEKGAAMARRMGVPRHLLIDTGHPAGLRMIEHGGYSQPASPRTAVLIECGQHWERASVDVARETVRRFLDVTGVLDYGRSAWTGDAPARALPSPGGQDDDAPRLVRVTHAVVARSLSFRFAGEYRGLEVIERAGDPIAYDGEETIRAPYYACAGDALESPPAHRQYHGSGWADSTTELVPVAGGGHERRRSRPWGPDQAPSVRRNSPNSRTQCRSALGLSGTCLALRKRKTVLGPRIPLQPVACAGLLQRCLQRVDHFLGRVLVDLGAGEIRLALELVDHPVRRIRFVGDHARTVDCCDARKALG